MTLEDSIRGRWNLFCFVLFYFSLYSFKNLLRVFVIELPSLLLRIWICFFSFHCDVGFWRAKHRLLRLHKFRAYLLIKQSLRVISTDIRSLFEEYFRPPGWRFGIIKPLTLVKSPAFLKETRSVFVPRSWFKSAVNLAIEEQVSQAVESRNTREFKQIATAGATTAAVTEKVWREYVSVVCQILAKRNTKMSETWT